jgi:hypothetical protein
LNRRFEDGTRTGHANPLSYNFRAKPESRNANFAAFGGAEDIATLADPTAQAREPWQSIYNISLLPPIAKLMAWICRASPFHTAPHVGVASGDPHPHPRANRDHGAAL